jgi:hypothetical protein
VSTVKPLSNTVFFTPWVSERPGTGATAVGVAAVMALPENGKTLRRKLRQNPISIYERSFISNSKLEITQRHPEGMVKINWQNLSFGC